MLKRFSRHSPIEVRLLHNLPDRPENGCWPWKGKLDNKGYGRIRWLGKRWLVHKLLYTLLVKEVEPGFELDHVRERGCTSRACCNLAHLEEVTHAENIRRGWLYRLKTHCPQGHPYSEENTYKNRNGHRHCITCLRASTKLFRANQPKGRPANGAKTHCPQGHPYSEENTYTPPRGGRMCRQCKSTKAGA